MRLCFIAVLLMLGACATHPGKVGHVVRAADRVDIDVRSRDGAVRGVSGAGVRAFLGMPYAAAPTGNLRWRAPQPVQPWRGTRDATRLGPDCVQAIGKRAILGGGGGMVFGDEDCLTLNLYAPAEAPERPRPVMVFIPGGAFTVGAGANYDPSRLATGQDRVVVTVNYRLGALGWLAHPDLAGEHGDPGGNWGLLDVQAALRWVRANIGDFGGDPDDVTVFGTSAGAWILCHLMAAPDSEGLWDRAILQSGACVEPTALWSADEAAASGADFAASAGCESEATLDCLRRLPAGTLARAASRRPGLNGPGSWGPVYGDQAVPVAPPLAFVRGDFIRTPVIVGTNRDEGRLFAVEVRDQDRYDKETVWMYGDVGPRVLEAYPTEPDGPALTMATSFTDQKFACPADALRRVLARHVPVWGYEFADPDAPFVLPQFMAPYDMGAYHASELTYVFGTPWVFADAGRFTPEQRALTDRMQGLWAGFGRAGFEADWPRVGEGGGPVRVLAPTGDRMDDEFAERRRCAFWATTPFGPVAPATRP